MKYSASSRPGHTFTLPRASILRGRDQIQSLFRQGKVLRENHLDLRYLLLPDEQGECLMAFIAGKRTGKAHQRNLTRRRMREAYRLHRHVILEPASSKNVGFKGLLIAKKTDVPYRLLEKQCLNLLHGIRNKIEAYSQ